MIDGCISNLQAYEQLEKAVRIIAEITYKRDGSICYNKKLLKLE